MTQKLTSFSGSFKKIKHLMFSIRKFLYLIITLKKTEEKKLNKPLNIPVILDTSIYSTIKRTVFRYHAHILQVERLVHKIDGRQFNPNTTKTNPSNITNGENHEQRNYRT